MEKKNSFLKIFSLIFGVVALCGLFCCSIISGFGKKVQTTSASANLSTLANANMNVNSNDLVHYNLTETTDNLGYYLNTSTLSGNVQNIYRMNSSSTYTFNSGYVYEFRVNVSDTLVSHINSMYVHFSITDNSTRLDGGSGVNLVKVGTEYSITFKVDTTFKRNANDWLISGNFNTSTTFSSSTISLRFYSSFYNVNSLYFKSSVMASFYNTYGGIESTIFDVDYYYNGILYNGLKVSLSYMSTNDTYLFTMSTRDAQVLGNIGIYFVRFSLYNMVSDLQFISGSDIANQNFLNIFNWFFTLTGYNSYDISTVTVQQYEQTIDLLNQQLQQLQEQNSELANQIAVLSNAYNEGYNVGFQTGVDSQQQFIESAYTDGYSAGYTEADNTDATVATVFSNILLVGMLPVDFFLRILNWEFLGINIASFVSALLSVATTIIVIRIVTGKKND